MRHLLVAIILCFCATHAAAQERCELGFDVPEEIKIQGIVVLVLKQPQCFGIYEDGKLSTRVMGRPLYGYASTGMRGHDTPLSDPSKGPDLINGSYRHYWSKKYSVFWQGRSLPAYMPYSMFFTHNGHALHQGRVDRKFASHGCVRLPPHAAQALFYGFPHEELRVIITHDRHSLRTEWE